MLVSVALGIPEGMCISYNDVGCLLPTVTSVRTARQVIDALNAEGPKIDIILTEVDLPIVKGLKMLKYIMRDTELRRIPIISKLICFFCSVPGSASLVEFSYNVCTCICYCRLISSERISMQILVHLFTYTNALMSCIL